MIHLTEKVDSATNEASIPQTAQAKEISTPLQRRVLVGSSAGQFIEFFDFSLYGLSAVILAQHFFPGGSTVVALLVIFATFGVAFLIRPLGGLFFGALGDRIGRRKTLAITLFMIGGSTALIGVLPTYEQIGLFAPILLVLVRLLQGISAGGESAGGPAFAFEHAPKKRRAMWVNITIAATSFSTVTASGVILLFDRFMEPATYEAWGWRVPFLLAIPLTVVGLWIRSKTEESQMFKDAKKNQEEDFNPIRESLKENRKGMFQVVIIVGTVALAIYYITAYFATYIEIVGELTRGQALAVTSITLGTFAVLLPFFGKIGDNVGRRPMIYAGSLLIAIVAIPAFTMVSSGNLTLAILGGLLFTSAILVYGGGCYVFFLEIFPTRTRYTSGALSYNIAYGLFGGTAPLMGTFLVEQSGNDAAPGYYMATVALIAFIVAVTTRIPETKSLTH